MSPIVTPFMSCTSLNIFSVYKLNKLDERTHPCHTPFLILHSAINPVSVLTTADCSQYKLVMICSSVSSTPISLRHSIILECFTQSNALV